MKNEEAFVYGGYHFIPIRQFRKNEGDFFTVSPRLESDHELGFSKYPEWKKIQYNYEAFYKAATDKTCDIFLCKENGRIYVPGENELFIYHEPQQKTKDSVIASLSKDTSAQNRNGKKFNHEPER